MTCRFLLILTQFHRPLLQDELRRLLLLLFYYAAVFSVKAKASYSPQRMLPLSRMFIFCWINNRPCKHLGTAPSFEKISSFKYFRESSRLNRAHFRCKAKVLPITAPNRMNPSLTFFVKRSRESKGYSSWSKICFLVALRHATTRSKPYRSTQSLRRAVKTKLLRPHQPRFRATRPGPAERSAIFAFGV